MVIVCFWSQSEKMSPCDVRQPLEVAKVVCELDNCCDYSTYLAVENHVKMFSSHSICSACL